MKYQPDRSDQLNQVKDNLKSGAFMSLKDYLAADDVSTNPYASIDDFLDETWNLDVSSPGNDTNQLPHIPNS